MSPARCTPPVSHRCVGVLPARCPLQSAITFPQGLPKLRPGRFRLRQGFVSGGAGFPGELKILLTCKAPPVPSLILTAVQAYIEPLCLRRLRRRHRSWRR